MTHPLDVLTCIRELTEPTTHREPFTITTIRAGAIWNETRHHVTSHPSLIVQLLDAIEPSSSAEDGKRPAFGSKPTARLEAIDAALRIDHESARWLRNLGHDDPGTTVDCVRGLGPHALDRDLAADIRRWWSWARTLTGWDTPPWKPANTCPICAERGTLRIRLAHHTGTCTNCWSTWEPDMIGLLADHIRFENHESVTA